MLLYFFGIFTLYYLFMLAIIYGWKKTAMPQTSQHLGNPPFVSVIIALRNEEKNVSKLMQALNAQEYHKEKFEVIMVDDNSNDGTVSEIQKFKGSWKITFKLISSEYHEDEEISPKKSALLKGIEVATGDILVMTDGDCWFGPEWLGTMVAAFRCKKTKLVAGPVAIQPGIGLLSKIQTLEFSSLTGTTGGLIGLRYPIMCNGANLAFRKTAFTQVGGYKGHEGQASGDDVYLMQKIFVTNPGSVVFCNNQEAVVYTLPQPSIFQIIHQRRRWASKWNSYLLPYSWALPIFIFIHYVTLFIGLTYTFFYPAQIWFLGSLVLFKVILDYIVLKKVSVFCKLPFGFPVFLLAEILYPFYALAIGISVHFGNYTWKERSYKT